MDEDRLTIDEFARQGGVATTTVRLYTAKGLLRPPHKQGRVGYYGPEHQQRLALITGLQERGFSLAGIKELLDAWDAGRNLEEVLGLPAGDQPDVSELDAATFASLFPDQDDREALLQQAVDSGSARPVEGGVVLPDPANLRLGLHALRLGIPLRELLAVYREVRDDTDRLARRFAEVVQRHVWQPLIADDTSTEKRTEARHAIAELAEVSVQVVSTAMRDAIVEVAREFADLYDEDIEDLLPKHQPGR